MSILDNLLGVSGEGSSATSFESVIATSPGLELHASDVLSASASGDDGGLDFTGIGDIGLGVSAPTVIGISGSSDVSGSGEVDAGGGGLLGGGGGLLGGLL